MSREQKQPLTEAATRQVDRLLHDAEHKDAGANMAATVGDTYSASRLQTQRDSLIRMASQIDPERESPAWDEVRLSASPSPADGGH